MKINSDHIYISNLSHDHEQVQVEKDEKVLQNLKSPNVRDTCKAQYVTLRNNCISLSQFLPYSMLAFPHNFWCWCFSLSACQLLSHWKNTCTNWKRRSREVFGSIERMQISSLCMDRPKGYELSRITCCFRSRTQNQCTCCIATAIQCLSFIFTLLTLWLFDHLIHSIDLTLFSSQQRKFVTAPHRRRKSYLTARTNKDFDLDRIVSYDSTSSRRIVLPKKQNIEVPGFVEIGYRTDEQIQYASPFQVRPSQTTLSFAFPFIVSHIHILQISLF
jgi:hypothetical protein